jgi:hypothetical protein
VSGAAALFLPAETIKAQHATASAIRHLSEREAAFSPQAILASALGFQIKGLEGGAVVQRIGELVREGHLIPGKSDRLDGHCRPRDHAGGIGNGTADPRHDRPGARGRAAHSCRPKRRWRGCRKRRANWGASAPGSTPGN